MSDLGSNTYVDPDLIADEQFNALAPLATASKGKMSPARKAMADAYAKALENGFKGTYQDFVYSQPGPISAPITAARMTRAEGNAWAEEHLTGKQTQLHPNMPPIKWRQDYPPGVERDPDKVGAAAKPTATQDARANPPGKESRMAGSAELASQGGAIDRVPADQRDMFNYWADYYGLSKPHFAAMIEHESGFNPKKPGTSGEIGLGQLMPDTAKGLGVTDRTDINQSYRGAAQYLRQMLDNPKAGGDYRKALMLYNSGPGGDFKNEAYANMVLSRLTGKPVGMVASGKGEYTPKLVSAGGNKLAPGQKPDHGGPDYAAAQAQNDRLFKTMQLMSIMRGMFQGMQFIPVSYDPMKVIGAGSGGDVGLPKSVGVGTLRIKTP